MPGRCCRPATCPARPRPWPPASRAPDTWRRTRGCRGRSPGGSGAPWRPPARAPPPPRSGSTRRHPHTAAWARGHEVLGGVCYSPPGGGTDLWSLPWPRSAWQVAVRARAQSSQSLEATRLLTCPEHWEKQSSCNYIYIYRSHASIISSKLKTTLQIFSKLRATSLPYFGVKLSCVCLMFAYGKK